MYINHFHQTWQECISKSKIFYVDGKFNMADTGRHTGNLIYDMIENIQYGRHRKT